MLNKWNNKRIIEENELNLRERVIEVEIEYVL